MHRAILEALTRQEWRYREEILKRLHKNIKEGATNFFAALYPHRVEGVVLYLPDIVDLSFLDLLIQVSDLVILPVPPQVSETFVEKSWGGVQHLLELWDEGKVLPMLSSPYESYSGIDFLDPLLEREPPCGAVRSRILLEFLAGEKYSSLAYVESKFIEYMPGDYCIKGWAASLLTELRVLGHARIAGLAEKAMSANFKAGLELAWSAARLLTVPVVSGFGAIPQYRNIDAALYETLPWGEVRRYDIATCMLSRRLDPVSVDSEEFQRTLLKLDENCKRGNEYGIKNSLYAIKEILRDNEGQVGVSIYLAKGPIVNSLKWAFIPIVVWELMKKQEREYVSRRIQLKIKEVRPGDSIKHPLGIIGTLGAFGLDEYGKLVPITARHVLTAGYTMWPSTFFFGEQEKELKYVVFNPRIKRLDEDLPAVLKKPIKPKRGMRVVMVGWKSGLKTGVILDEQLPNEPYYFEIRGYRFSVSGRTLFTASLGATEGDSGALVLSEDGRFPVGMVVASSREDPSVTYCHRLVDICPKLGVKGIFCPIGLPKGSSEFLRRIVASLVPDCLFQQSMKIVSKSEENILRDLGVTRIEDTTHSIDYRRGLRKRKAKLRIGEEIIYRGRLAFSKKGEIVGIAFAASEKNTVVMPIERIEKALCLKMLKTTITL